MNLLNANNELVSDKPVVVVLLNIEGEVAQFSTNACSTLEVIVTRDPSEYQKQTLGLPFKSPPLASLHGEKRRKAGNN